MLVKFSSRVTRGGGGQGHRDEGVTRGEGVKIAKFTVTYFMDDPLQEGEIHAESIKPRVSAATLFPFARRVIDGDCTTHPVHDKYQRSTGRSCLEKQI